MERKIKHQREALYALGRSERLLVIHEITKAGKGLTRYRLSGSGKEVRPEIVENLKLGGLIRPYDPPLIPGEEPQSYEMVRTL